MILSKKFVLIHLQKDGCTLRYTAESPSVAGTFPLLGLCTGDGSTQVGALPSGVMFRPNSVVC